MLVGYRVEDVRVPTHEVVARIRVWSRAAPPPDSLIRNLVFVLARARNEGGEEEDEEEIRDFSYDSYIEFF